MNKPGSSTLAVSRPEESGIWACPSAGDLRIGFEDRGGAGVSRTQLHVAAHHDRGCDLVGSSLALRADAESFVRRSTALHVPGLVIEFEQLPAMTDRPQWGAEITALLHAALVKLHESTGYPLCVAGDRG